MPCSLYRAEQGFKLLSARFMVHTTSGGPGGSKAASETEIRLIEFLELERTLRLPSSGLSLY